MTKFLGADGRIRDDGLPGMGQGGWPAAATTGNPPTATAQTAAIAAIVETSPNDGAKHHYRFSVTITITVVGTGSINAQIAYTDDSGVARTKIVPLTNTAGVTTNAAVSAVDTYTGVIDFVVNPNTTITPQTAGVFTGGFAYNASRHLERLR